MKSFRLLPAAAALVCASLSGAIADTGTVASIKPVHSLVAGVMQGVGAPGLIVQGAASPHSYSLKPSQASLIEDARLIFWIGHQMESFLEKTIDTIGANAKSVELIDTPDLVKLEYRQDGDFESHDHDEEQEAAETEHDSHGNSDHKEDHEHDHDEDHVNAHIWLDPFNAKILVRKIEQELILADPGNSEAYKANAEIMAAKLDALTRDIKAILAPVTNRNFIVFHDAYHHFENRFGVTAAGSITISPEILPGAERIAEIQSKIKRLGTACVFAEPQFEPRLVSVVIEGTTARSATLDPLGANLDDGPELYFDLIRNMANSLYGCLSGKS